MNLQKGLNRIFILLALVAAGFGCKFGGDTARYNWAPSLQEAFQSVNWNDHENINKYYLTAKNIEKIDKIRKARAEKDRHKSDTSRNLFLELPPRVKTKTFLITKRCLPNIINMFLETHSEMH